jgi:LAS superfamily LD-carboxypeptidase LdcB
MSRKIFLSVILILVLAYPTLGGDTEAISDNFELREVYSKPQNNEGDVLYFFIPQEKGRSEQFTYVYDTKFDRMLCMPKNSRLFRDSNSRELTREELKSIMEIMEVDDSWVKFTIGKRHIILPKKLMVGMEGMRTEDFQNLPLGKEAVDKLHSLRRDYKPNDLVRIDQKWNYHTEKYPKYLRRFVAQMLERMLQNAEEQGVHIRVFSAYRSFENQRYLYMKAESRFGPEQASVAKPGHSEHQLGTALDLCGLDPQSVLSKEFGNTREGMWLRENALRFGFRQSYTEENRHETGYIPEPWHYRFFGL